jgi:hypothetical protein
LIAACATLALTIKTARNSEPVVAATPQPRTV